MRESKYWDEFNNRAIETANCIKNNTNVPVRRVAVHVTDKCNMKCSYCKHVRNNNTMTEECFNNIVKKYGNDAIIHITGGEPSTVSWLYPYLIKNADKYRFHLNTNMYIKPPANAVKRLKVSLDSSDKEYWNNLTHTKAFDSVVKNIKECSKETILSITCTLTHENIHNIKDFVFFCNEEFPDIYAIFFSIYKGANENFVLTEHDSEYFFTELIPFLQLNLSSESRHLLNETITEKFRLIQGVRFPENDCGTCYLSMSERVFSPDGTESHCSHLYRDGINSSIGVKHSACKYGCNRRLVDFNNYVKELLKF